MSVHEGSAAAHRKGAGAGAGVRFAANVLLCVQALGQFAAASVIPGGSDALAARLHKHARTRQRARCSAPSLFPFPTVVCFARA